MEERASNSEKILEFFKEICDIPHISFNSGPITDYLVNFAVSRGLEYVRDGADNLVIYKKATAGYEHRPTVIIQGHTDMVEAKVPGCERDLGKLGVELVYDGDFVKANGTTLGADNGVAVAYMLALLDGGEDIKHPNIEAVFTSNEEVGLIGAKKLDKSLLNGKIMLNLDSDCEGEFIAACAGGAGIQIKLYAEREACDGDFYTLTIKDLTSGHSGADIHKGRENAIRLLFELLSDLDYPRISSVKGGAADNVIPASVECVFTAKNALSDIEARLSRLKAGIISHEPDVKISIVQNGKVCNALTEKKSADLIKIITKMPNGVYKMSEFIENSVETSSNIGVINTDDDAVTVRCSTRSMIETEKQNLINIIVSNATENGADVTVGDGYPGWQFKQDSNLQKTVKAVYRDMFGTDAVITSIHAGLECGIFSDAIPGLDCISFGPTAIGIHTTEERLSVPSFKRMYNFLVKLLKEI